jgi:hypothetical protein
VILVRKDTKAFRGLRVLMEQEVHKVILAHKDTKEHRVQKVLVV